MIWKLLKRLYNSIMAAPDNIITNASKIASTSYFPTDRVAASQIINTSVTNSVGTYTLTFPAYGSNVNVGDQFLRPLGIYSYDAGTTWNDLGYGVPGGSLNKQPGLITPAVGIAPVYDYSTDKVSFTVTVNSTVGVATTIPLQINIVLLDGSTGATFVNGPNSQIGKIASANVTPAGTPTQYRQILSDGQNVANSAFKVDTVAHNVSTIPACFVWMQKTLGNGEVTVAIKPMFWDYRAPGSTAGLLDNGVAMDSTNLYFAEISGGSYAYFLYRLYREN